MRALEKRPEDRYQSAEEMRHDLEEFLEESGLRSGNRRMALYMQELFAPDAATSDAGVERRRVVRRARPQRPGRRRRRRDRREFGRAGSRSARAACDAHRGCPRARRAGARSAAGRRRQGQMTPRRRRPASGVLRPSAAASGAAHAQPAPPSATGTSKRARGGLVFIAVCVAIGDRGDGNHDVEMISSRARRERPARACAPENRNEIRLRSLSDQVLHRGRTGSREGPQGQM